MLISALNQYYDVLIEKNELPPAGYEKLDISYLIALTEDGKLDHITDIRTKIEEKNKKGKIKVLLNPKPFMFPERNTFRGIKTNYVEHRGGYIFGLEFRTEGEALSLETKGATEEKRAKLSKQHQDFLGEVNKDFKFIQSPIAKAYYLFSQNWQPEHETENSELLKIKKDLNTAKFAFCLASDSRILLQNDKKVKEHWRQVEEDHAVKTQEDIEQCAISGEMLPIARLHDVLKSGKGIGVRDAGINPSLVNFNCDSFESYSHNQGQNACISDKVMKHYTQALNWLLASQKNHSYLNGMTLVYWSQDGNQNNDQLVMKLFSRDPQYNNADQLDTALDKLIADINQGMITTERLEAMYGAINPNTDYYIVGLAPNSSRVQVKFIYRQKFGKLLTNIAKHQRDLKINNSTRPVQLWQLKKELTSPKTSHPEVNDVPFASIFKSIILGTVYPTWCFSTMLRRIRTDHNTEDSSYIRMNDVRVGLIKAYLIRKTKEEIAMSLDKSNTNPAYLCGRLFAVLEEIQEDAAKPHTLNRTIEDAYFSSACVRPASIFPKLMKLSQHHMAKLKRNQPGWAVNDQKRLNEIIEKMGDEFPKVLNLDDQGRFTLGYYQQRAEKYKKANQETKGEETK
ncbi:MAG: type I-C CRISPR-associated protein Cas8c/Csd1 [Eubacteriaceae bacterium]|jgi:CRISPR-associated protein Csd1|uniref:Type I-C CRISPR-associated protein Cas8c/Csd1 n=1 Tax=Candidatus Pseudoramibacter fermentans TaxID=2594427 RepID=A0A6L5GTM6_9FIRM|nr:type I-C CRISPR-associated protein Cas8c/Csd1 [Candidatus Pseudoramibacter fermentans]RRF93441.1 MAG: type I-C CRISPR-associated protein Cas8c/Csd1 [Eubacteriaceae bacterium]